MKRVIFFFLCLMPLCFALGEDVDWTTMSAEEWSEYTLTLSLRDALVLLDRMDEDPGEVFQEAYDQQVEDFADISETVLFVHYAAIHTIMEQHDLLKYLPILNIEPTTSTGADLSEMSFEELAALRSQALIEMMARSDWQEVDVQAGTYQVGVDIPSGHWVITCSPSNYCYVTVGATLDENKKDIVYGSKGYYHVAMAGTESGISDRGYPSSVDLELADGMYVCIERSYVTFTPYTGTTGFVFK